MTAVFDESSSPVREAVLRGLAAYNERFLGPGASVTLAVAAREADGTIVGGATGRVWHERLFVDLLWVEEAHRGQGLGSRVLREIEAEARRRGATKAFLDTFTFQAAPFYEKLGYREVARIPRFFGDHDRIYLEKSPL